MLSLIAVDWHVDAWWRKFVITTAMHHLILLVYSRPIVIKRCSSSFWNLPPKPTSPMLNLVLLVYWPVSLVLMVVFSLRTMQITYVCQVFSLMEAGDLLMLSFRFKNLIHLISNLPECFVGMRWIQHSKAIAHVPTANTIHKLANTSTSLWRSVINRLPTTSSLSAIVIQKEASLHLLRHQLAMFTASHWLQSILYWWVWLMTARGSLLIYILLGCLPTTDEYRSRQVCMEWKHHGFILILSIRTHALLRHFKRQGSTSCNLSSWCLFCVSDNRPLSFNILADMSIDSIMWMLTRMAMTTSMWIFYAIRMLPLHINLRPRICGIPRKWNRLVLHHPNYVVSFYPTLKMKVSVTWPTIVSCQQHLE